MTQDVKKGITTFARISGKIILRLLYIISAFILSIALSVATVYYVGMHYYENYYQEFMNVQQGWADLDEDYTAYINELKKNISTIQTHVNSEGFKKAKASEMEYINTKLNVLKTDLPAADYSMAYQDKFSTYPSIMQSANELIYFLNDSENEDIKGIIANLKEIQVNIDKNKKEYNELAHNFNQTNQRFPEKYFSNIASFNDWPEFK